MKEIKLTQGKVALVDDEDFEYLNQFKWYAFKRKHTYYVARSEYRNGIKKIILMHRVIMKTPDNLVPDHIDHNGLNNQKYNLRNVTYSGNNKNRINSRRTRRTFRTHETNQYIGICYITRIYKDKTYEYIQSYISHNNKNTYLGIFKTEKEAAQAYNEAAKKYYGEFASLNIIE